MASDLRGGAGTHAHRFRAIVARWRRSGSDESARLALRRALGLWRDGGLDFFSGNDSVALDTFERILLLLQGHPDAGSEVLALRQQALAGFGAALDISRTIGDRPVEAQSLRGVGLGYLRQGDLPNANATLLEALDLVRQPRITFMESIILESMSELGETAED